MNGSSSEASDLSFGTCDEGVEAEAEEVEEGKGTFVLVLGAAFNVTAEDFACSCEEEEGGKDFKDLFTASNGKVEAELDNVKSLVGTFKDGNTWLGGGYHKKEVKAYSRGQQVDAHTRVSHRCGDCDHQGGSMLFVPMIRKAGHVRPERLDPSFV